MRAAGDWLKCEEEMRAAGDWLKCEEEMRAAGDWLKCEEDMRAAGDWLKCEEDMRAAECKGEDTVSQPAGDVLLTQGDTVEIECSFQTGDNTAYLYWYKQEGRGPPGHMMQKTRSLFKWLDTVKSPEFKENRFEVEAQDNSFHLIIQDVDVTDSAVYYCALRPTVTGNTKTLNKNLWSKDNTILQ
ncbi:hypothetical protein WMY93_000292 [Mugilogobius chulae]|uniref:Ig-like domain-containing protein n=1 Tax=Mugilogobius chulae TaxID=88201 RepID=A0AAW0Q4M3_9GOBI